MPSQQGMMPPQSGAATAPANTPPATTSTTQPQSAPPAQGTPEGSHPLTPWTNLIEDNPQGATTDKPAQ